MNQDVQVKLRIFKDGQVKAVVSGAGGERCLDYIPLVESLIDAEVLDSAFTEEYHATVNTNVHVENTAQQQKTLQASSGKEG